MAIEIKGDKDILKEIEKMTEEQFIQCMNELFLEMVNSATEKAYEKKSKYEVKRNNNLKSDIVNSSVEPHKDGNNVVAEIKATMEYAEYVEHGTGEFADQHRGGKRTKYLGKIPSLAGKTFKNKKGKEYVNKKGYVMIKGQEPKHFMLRTEEEFKPKIKDYFKLDL